MDSNTAAAPASLKQEAMYQNLSTICDLCEGFGKEDHPRSKSIPAFDGEIFYYIYLHYPNVDLVRISYERYKCRICRMILTCLLHHSDSQSTRSMSPHDEPASDDTNRLASFDIAQDTFEASRLLISAEIDFDPSGLSNFLLRIQGCRSGRLALGVMAKSRKGPQADTDSDRADSSVTVYVFDTSPVARTLQRVLQVWCSPIDPIDEDHVHRPARDLLSDAHIGLVRRWMNTCEAEHEICTRNKGIESLQKLPTRLLKIEGRNGEVMRMRLVDTNDFTGVYACLSYCWGSNRQIFMTTKANRSDYRHAIPWQELPSTINDAIKLCYKLEFEYLWIDSLCIIQDDCQDWLQEASRMAGIYTRSALTLAIHLCEDTSQSFLQRRYLDTEQWSDGPSGSARISYADSSTGDKMNLYIWEDQSFKGSRFLDRWWRSIEEIGRHGPSGHWFRRAWTFQEWFLSPRVLHIHAMTVWDCFGSHGNELEKRFLCKRHLPTRAFPETLDWPQIVADFTSRQITLEKDRLPALAGLAERFQARTEHTYLAGLWLEDLPESLTWTRRQRKPMSRPVNYRAPTWSWAALEGEVSFPYFDRSDLSRTCDILEQYCKYDPPETFATVIDGWIDVEGPMAVARAWATHAENFGVPQIRLFTDGQPEDTQNPRYWIATMDQDKIPELARGRSEVHLLDLLAQPDWPDEGDLRRYALVLQVVTRPGMAKDCFQRLGTACLDISSSSSPVTDSWSRRTIRLI